MNEEHVKVFSGSPIFVSRLKSLLKENNILSITKSDTIVGYEISNYIDDLFVLSSDLNEANKIIDSFQKEISE